jgi:hypothetical protein
MQKWEYLVIYHTYVSATEYTLQINNDKPLVTPEGADVTSLLNRFGEQGWELVESHGGCKHIFKRPKS